jgi:hypothetical protein
MISISFDSDKKFAKQMQNLSEYSFGFIEGVNAGKHIFFATFGEKVKEIMELFIDSMARQNPEMLHHVYEWHQTGSPEARLFDLNYTVSNLGLSFKSNFRQSTSVKNGSKVPFTDKASIMEGGLSVSISPVQSDALVFDVNGKTVFTRETVNVSNPGGQEVQGSFERTFDLFVTNYFTQAFMQTAGIIKRFGSLTTYKKNLQAGLRVGRQAGIPTGYRWIANLGVGE